MLPDNNPLAGRTVAVINLPHAEKLVRRYMCTYRSPYFFFPPHELLQAATCIREGTGAKVVFLDAIGEDLNESQVSGFLGQYRPDFLIVLLGVESVATDLSCAIRLSRTVPGMCLAVFGYYATQFPGELLKEEEVHAVFRGDVEASCIAYIMAGSGGQTLEVIPGLAGRDGAGRVFINEPAYIKSFDRLPFPDYTLLNLKRYNDMLLGGPFASVHTTRGCPFACAYCTSPQDRRYVARSPEQVAEELEGLTRLGVRVVRFLDDTFTADTQRVISICKEIIRRRIVLKWTCLSRVDTLDADMLDWMRKAGCVRVVVGVESYSSRVLDVFGKHIVPETINKRLQLIRDAGMESIGFIIVGGPFENEEDFELTRRGLLASPLDWIIVDSIAVYGGSTLAERFRDEIEFQLIPYVSRWREAEIDRVGLNRERILYRQFYLRPHILFRQMMTILRYPAASLRLFVLLIEFIRAPFRAGERRDLF